MLDVVFDLATDHGRCVGVRVPEDPHTIDALALALLRPEERASAAAGAALARRRAWVGGRAAMRTLLDRMGIAASAVLTDDRGAPVLPTGVAGSISHKHGIAVALAAVEPVARVGVDVEIDAPLRDDVAARILDDAERQAVGALPEDEGRRDALLRFSLKEAVYKAIDPFVRRYVGFREVGVFPDAGGRARVVARLTGGEGPFAVSARWQRIDGLVLTTARAARLEG